MMSAVGSRAHPLLDRKRWRETADWLAVASVASLPWSTSATGILVAVWAVAAFSVLTRDRLRECARVPSACLPAALVGLAAIGMLWAQAPFGERLAGLASYVKLLAIPVLMIQFSESARGPLIVRVFLISCALKMAVSWITALFPSLWPFGMMPGVPVKDYIIQSGEFLLCAFGLAHLALDAWQRGDRRRAAWFAIASLLFLANIVYVATSRTSIIVFFGFVLLLALQRFSKKGVLATLIVGVVFAGVAAASSHYLRMRAANVWVEIEDYRQKDMGTSTGYRLEMWRKSVDIIAKAPIIGHGTGSTQEMFRREAIGKSGMAAMVTDNPHNQTMIIAIHLGLIGVILLYAMWVSHAMLFMRPGLYAALGLAIVVQNVISALSNSQLFYFSPGWLYAFGVGVLGGMLLRDSRKAGAMSDAVAHRAD